jgi:hypothetical protein
MELHAVEAPALVAMAAYGIVPLAASATNPGGNASTRSP